MVARGRSRRSARKEVPQFTNDVAEMCSLSSVVLRAILLNDSLRENADERAKLAVSISDGALDALDELHAGDPEEPSQDEEEWADALDEAFSSALEAMVAQADLTKDIDETVGDICGRASAQARALMAAVQADASDSDEEDD